MVKMTKIALRVKRMWRKRWEYGGVTGWACKQGGKTEGLLDASPFIDNNELRLYVHGKSTHSNSIFPLSTLNQLYSPTCPLVHPIISWHVRLCPANKLKKGSKVEIRLRMWSGWITKYTYQFCIILNFT